MFTFLDMAGKTLFVRDDAERAQWTQEELSLDLEFPYVDGKVVDIGQRVFFKDPSTGEHQIYEIKQPRNTEPEHFQTVHAEHICVSELTDEHMDNKEMLDQSARDALQSVLSGTLWSVGSVKTNPVSSAELSRGSVWQAILEIRTNWNVYIEPRVTLNENGTITRKLDILSVDGEWNGLRLSVDKNMLDPVVTFDDSEVATAIYGYGGTTTATKQGEEEVEINFAGVVWSKTSDHPAKPAGQKYLEDPEATKLYGRNGRPRFGFYQNTDILDPNVLLQKTWENLKAARYPAISVDGTVADLRRLGYADEPIKLHTVALVEVLPLGFKKKIQITRMTTDLLDPSATTLNIGAYIPNIVYIAKETNYEATGEQGGRSGGGGGGGAAKQTERSEFETEITRNNRRIELRAYQNDLNDLDNEVKRQDARITVQANRITQEVIDRREQDTELSGRITVTAKEVKAEVTRAEKAEKKLQGSITVNSDKISLVVKETQHGYEVNAASIMLGINEYGSNVKISADRIDLVGYVTVRTLEVTTDAKIHELVTGQVHGSLIIVDRLQCGAFQRGSTTYTDKTVKDTSGNTIHVLGY